mgnify:CR=1 FL=1
MICKASMKSLTCEIARNNLGKSCGSFALQIFATRQVYGIGMSDTCNKPRQSFGSIEDRKHIDGANDLLHHLPFLSSTP